MVTFFLFAIEMNGIAEVGVFIARATAQTLWDFSVIEIVLFFVTSHVGLLFPLSLNHVKNQA